MRFEVIVFFFIKLRLSCTALVSLPYCSSKMCTLQDEMDFPLNMIDFIGMLIRIHINVANRTLHARMYLSEQFLSVITNS